MYHYSPENAAIYSQLGIIGTTYEVSFNEMARVLGDLKGRTVLDYGTGAGRSARLLQTLGAQRVLGVDHDPNMIKQAKLNEVNGIEFHQIQDEIIPLDDNSVDAAVTAHVFVEMRSKDEMIRAAKEISRVLKPGGKLVVISTSPDSVGHDYVSYRYKPKTNLKSGDPITCVVKAEKPFEIDDTYWTEEDYVGVLRDTGFTKAQVSYPIAQGDGWLEETKVAPDILLVATK